MKTVLLSLVFGVARQALAIDTVCDAVLYESVDHDLHVRTMVVEDDSRQRMLVLTSDDDTSEPCTLEWWLTHNPQGVIQCTGPAAGNGTEACAADTCHSDRDAVELGYVRTMIASSLFAPQPHVELSALCIEMGCKSRVHKARAPQGSLLEADAGGHWAPRSPKRVLVIGLGSSTMALWMRRHMPHTMLDVAELVPGVVASAPCFGLGTDDGLHLHVGDGRGFLDQAHNSTYDAILVDAFDSNASLPACFRTEEFFALAKSKLVPGGALSFNLLSSKKSLRVLKSLASNFDSKAIWVGEAPGAEGIQNVITAFSGKAARGQRLRGETVSAAAQSADVSEAKDWFDRAHYQLLDEKVLEKTSAFRDATECPAARAATAAPSKPASK